MAYNIFGFEIRKAAINPALTSPTTNDGAVEHDVSGSSAGAYGVYLDLNKRIVNEVDLINKYRAMANYPEIDNAIEDIVDEAIVSEDDKAPVSINFRVMGDEIPLNVQEMITAEFETILSLYDFKAEGHDIFRQWYVDGRYYSQIIVDETNLKLGIQEIRNLDPRKTKKVRELTKTKGPGGIEVVTDVQEYFIYGDTGTANTSTGIKLSPDTIIHATSGRTDEYGNTISFLNKAIKPSNQLRYMEDAALIYTLSRAPSRRVFYIDIADMPKQKADQYMQNIMTKFKNKVVYNAGDGTLSDDRNHMTMMDDFFLPRRCFSLDTKVKLLDGRNVSIGDLAIEYQEGKKNWTYSVSDEGTIVPGLITWAGTTMKDAEVIDIHLDNGEVITCTPDHKFILRNGKKLEAKNLSVGSSLMPLYTEKRSLRKASDYEYVLDNKTNKWGTTHKMVKQYFDPIQKGQVIHHADFDRFNNNPENLVLMEKYEHIRFHGEHASEAWKTASPEKLETWKNNLSISGKEFFETEAGEKRKGEISEHNKLQVVLDGLAKGRATIDAMRKSDKEVMTHEEFLAKWHPNQVITPEFAQKQRRLDKENMSAEDYYDKWVAPITNANKEIYNARLATYDMSLVLSKVSEKMYPMITNPEIVDIIKSIYPELNLAGIRTMLNRNGYDTISDFICRNFSDLAPRRKYQAKNQNAVNHKVTKIIQRSDRMDVGTLTVDGDETMHSYHNYALSAGVFVMNSNGRSTEIQQLPSENITGQIENIMYFLNKVYGALNIPLSRVKQDAGFSLGRSQEITRDELKFSKFIDRIRNKFSDIFLQALRVQLVLKGIITPEDWEFIKSRIAFDYQRDNYFTELKESEILTNRIQMAEMIQPFVGTYYSPDYVRKNILKMSDEDIEAEREGIMAAQEELAAMHPQGEPQ